MPHFFCSSINSTLNFNVRFFSCIWIIKFPFFPSYKIIVNINHPFYLMKGSFYCRIFKKIST